VFTGVRRQERMFFLSLSVFSKNSTPPPTTAGKKKSVKRLSLDGILVFPLEYIHDVGSTESQVSKANRP